MIQKFAFLRSGSWTAAAVLLELPPGLSEKEGNPEFLLLCQRQSQIMQA